MQYSTRGQQPNPQAGEDDFPSLFQFTSVDAKAFPTPTRTLCVSDLPHPSERLIDFRQNPKLVYLNSSEIRLTRWHPVNWFQYSIITEASNTCSVQWHVALFEMYATLVGCAHIAMSSLADGWKKGWWSSWGSIGFPAHAHMAYRPAWIT